MKTRIAQMIAAVVLVCGWSSPGSSQTPCPTTYQALSAKNQGATCFCSAEATRVPRSEQLERNRTKVPRGAINPEEHVPHGSVWGTLVYTTDSSICAAARHAGAIGDSGGKVTVRPADGCWGYEGTTRNGVTSSKWGWYRASFYFPGRGSGQCPQMDIPKTGPSDPNAVGRFRSGDRVLCRWQGRNTEYGGTVSKRMGGHLMIEYDDGDREVISPALCRKGQKRPAGTGQADPNGAAQFRVGDRVMCRWRDGKTEYPGGIANKRGGYLIIDYDDGSKETIGPALCRRE